MRIFNFALFSSISFSSFGELNSFINNEECSIRLELTVTYEDELNVSENAYFSVSIEKSNFCIHYKFDNELGSTIEGCLIDYNRLKEKCKINYKHFGEDFLKGILMFLSNSKELHSLFRTTILEPDGKKLHIIKPIILPIIFVVRDSLDNEALPFEKDNFLLVLK